MICRKGARVMSATQDFYPQEQYITVDVRLVIVV